VHPRCGVFPAKLHAAPFLHRAALALPRSSPKTFPAIMETGLLHLHNIARWAVVIFGLLALYRGATGLGGRRAYTPADRKTALWLLISTHIQLVLGLVLYFLRPTREGSWASMLINGGSAVMKDKVLRFWTIEHGPVMILAVVFITIGYSASKRATTDKARFGRWFWWTLAGFIIVLSAIPWPWREAVGRGLFPGVGA